MPLPTAAQTTSSNALNPMSFTENQHGNVVLERLRQQRESGRFCDVLLHVRDRQLCAHRNILAAGSPYFDSILNVNKIAKEAVHVRCVNPDVFELLLNYMYSGSVVIDRSSVMELLKLANNFLVTKLKNYCAEYLDRYLDAINCITVKELATKYNMPGLLKNACEYLEANINRCLLESGDILEFSLAQVKQMLNDPNYRLTITSDVYLRFIVRWVWFKLDERELVFKELLSGTSLSQVNRDTFSQLLDTAPLLDRSETARFALLQAMYESSLSLSKYDTQYQSLLAKYSGEVNIYFNDSNNLDGVMHDMSSSNYAVLQALPVNYEPGPDPMNNMAVGDTTSASSFDNAVMLTSVEPMNNVYQQQSSSRNYQQHSSAGIVKIEMADRINSTGGYNLAPQAIGGGATTTADTANAQNNTASQSTVVTSADSRPALKLTLKLPLINRKNRILGKNKFYRKSISTANQTLLNKRRGRPPKFRARMRLGVDSPFYPDCGINLDEPVIFDEEDDEDEEEEDDDEDGGLVVDEGGNCVGASASNEYRSAEDAKAEVIYRCPNCIYAANTQSRITAHISRAHSRNVIFVCSLCQFECKWNREYYTHMKSHFNGPPFCCDTCDYNAERIQMLLTHRMKHTDERPFKCTQCEYRCRTKTNLLAHMRSHTGEKPFSCTECGRGFAIKSTLDQHLATHSDTRPFRCDQCSFSTKYQSHLISHKRIHTGDVFHCQFPECSYSSPKKSQLAAHLRTHLAVRAHTCNICNRSFIEKSHLVRHERIHLADKPFKCEHCDYASSRRDKLKEHIQKHHGSASAVSKQHRRRYRRAKQFAQLQQHNKAALLKAAAQQQPTDETRMFRPIAPDGVVPNAAATVPVTQTHQHNHTVDIGHLLSPMMRPSSAIVGHHHSASMHGISPSSALSLNFNLGGYDTVSVEGYGNSINIYQPLVASGKDVVLGAQMAPTPTESLVTPDPTPRSPASMSNNSLQSEPFPNVHTPSATLDMQRPMSLPSGSQPWSTSAASELNLSFTAMF